MADFPACTCSHARHWHALGKNECKTPGCRCEVYAAGCSRKPARPALRLVPTPRTTEPR